MSILRKAKDWVARFKAAKAAKEAAIAMPQATKPTAQPATPAAASADAIDFASLEWKFGGDDGSKAALSTPRLVEPDGAYDNWASALPMDAFLPVIDGD